MTMNLIELEAVRQREEARLRTFKGLAIVVSIICIILILTAFFAHASEIGTASWYSYESCIKEGSNGRYTASGEKFNHEELTCASWAYRFGQLLQVTNLSNGKKVTVRVNDRGPSKRLVKRGRIIDLSKAAFSRIARLEQGVVPIKVDVIERRKKE